MSNKDKISLYSFITDKYEVSADEIEKEFGIVVGKQFNAISEMASNSGSINGSSNDRRIMSDEEYYKRYGHRRGERKNSSNVSFKLSGKSVLYLSTIILESHQKYEYCKMKFYQLRL